MVEIEEREVTAGRAHHTVVLPVTLALDLPLAVTQVPLREHINPLAATTPLKRRGPLLLLLHLDPDGYPLSMRHTYASLTYCPNLPRTREYSEAENGSSTGMHRQLQTDCATTCPVRRLPTPHFSTSGVSHAARATTQLEW